MGIQHCVPCNLRRDGKSEQKQQSGKGGKNENGGEAK